MLVQIYFAALEHRLDRCSPKSHFARLILARSEIRWLRAVTSDSLVDRVELMENTG